MRKTPILDKPLRGALFDMDGTLVDNSAVHVRAFERFCNRYGVTDWQEKLNRAFGMGSDDILRMILPEEVIRERGLQPLADEKEAIYREIYAPEIRPVAGLRALLDTLRREGVRCAVGSSGCRENVDFVLEKCSIAGYFDAIVSGDAVTHCKPNPEIYLTAAKKLGLSPKECIVFEDAEAGIEAAERAEVGRIVVVATTLTPDYIRDHTDADRIVNDFTEIRSVEELA